MITQTAAPKWRPIETAPKDGSEFLIAWVGEDAVVGWWERARGYFAWHEAARPRDHQPTHWMPIPSPPEQAA